MGRQEGEMAQARAYSWIGCPVQTHTKKYAARPRGLRRIWIYGWKALDEAHPMVRGKIYIFLFWRVILKKWWKWPKKLHCTVGCASSKALIRRSQVLLRCLSLAANYFFRKSSCCVFARKSISLLENDRIFAKIAKNIVFGRTSSFFYFSKKLKKRPLIFLMRNPKLVLVLNSDSRSENASVGQSCNPWPSQV